MGLDPGEAKSMDKAKKLINKLHEKGLIPYSLSDFRLPKLTVETDGLCEPNPGGVATYGFVVMVGSKEIASGDNVVAVGHGASNNVAEYSGAIAAMKWLIERKMMGEVELRSDSQLMIRQLTGQYTVKSERIMPLYEEAKRLAARFKKITFTWIPREQNKRADALSMKAYCEFLERPRLERAKEITDIKLVADGYLVKEKYLVMLQGKPSCTCHDYRNARFQIRCKHIFAVLLKTGELNGGQNVAVGV